MKKHIILVALFVLINSVSAYNQSILNSSEEIPINELGDRFNDAFIFSLNEEKSTVFDLGSFIIFAVYFIVGILILTSFKKVIWKK